MKRLMVTSLILCAGISVGANAACTSNTKVSGIALRTLIEGNTVCAFANGDRWQEQHRIGGALYDYKKGLDDKVDPTALVGNWSIDVNTVTYSYTGGLSYTYSVHDDGGTYSFCSDGSPVVSGATFRSGTAGGC